MFHCGSFVFSNETLEGKTNRSPFPLPYFHDSELESKQRSGSPCRRLLAGNQEPLRGDPAHADACFHDCCGHHLCDAKEV